MFTDTYILSTQHFLFFNRFASAQSEPAIDTNSHISQATAFVSDGDMVIQFTRPRNSGDGDDISLDQCRFLLYAFGGPFTISTNTAGYHGFANRGATSAVVCFPNSIVCPDVIIA